MELRHLRYFVLVAEELHFGRAAERAGIAQPPLSQQIRALEAELGARLFHRTNRRVWITDAGKALLPDARRLLDDSERVARRAREAASGLHGHFRLGFVGSSAFEWLPWFVGQLHASTPGIELELREFSSEQQREALHTRQIDIGLVRYPMNDPGMHSEWISAEPLRAVLPESSGSLPVDGPVTARDLDAIPLVMFPREYGPPLYDQIMSLFQEVNVVPDVRQEAVQMVTIVSLVSAGVGAAIVPGSLERVPMRGVHYRTFNDAAGTEPVSDLYLVRRADDDSQVVQRTFELAQGGSARASGRE